MKRGTKLLYKKIFAGLLGGGMLFMPNKLELCAAERRTGSDQYRHYYCRGQGDGYNRQRQCGDRLEQF